MCGIKLKLYFLVSVSLLLLLPVFCSADTVLTDEEYDMILESLETSSEELTAAQQEIARLKKLLKNSEISIVRLQSVLIEQATELGTLKINSELQSKSYETLKKRVDLIWIDRVGFGLIGVGIGVGVNEIYNRLDK